MSMQVNSLLSLKGDIKEQFLILERGKGHTHLQGKQKCQSRLLQSGQPYLSLWEVYGTNPPKRHFLHMKDKKVIESSWYRCIMGTSCLINLLSVIKGIVKKGRAVVVYTLILERPLRVSYILFITKLVKCGLNKETMKYIEKLQNFSDCQIQECCNSGAKSAQSR